MDRNQFLGLVLMLVMLTVYFQFFAPEPPLPEVDNEPVASGTVQDTAATVTNQTVTNVAQQDSALQRFNEMKYGLFSQVANGTEQLVEVETNLLNLTFSTKGGRLQKVLLNEYETYDQQPLTLFDERSSIDIFFEHLSRQISLSDLFFDTQQQNYGDSTEIRFSINVNGASLTQVYTVYDDSYEIGYRIISRGFEKQIDAKNLSLYWNATLPQVERELKDARIRTTLRYYATDGDTDYLSKTSTDQEQELIEKPVKWLAINHKFFTSGIIANNSFSKAQITSTVPLDESIVKNGNMLAEIPYTDLSNQETNYTFFFGPNKYYTLRDVGYEFDENLELGWWFLPVFNKYLIIPIWSFLEDYISNYGLLIIIMVLIIRLIISPLTYKSHISMAKMRVLKPELDAIKERNGDDMQKAQSEQMDLYRKAGINPLSGCIPMLLQFPILVSLFFFIPSAIELRLVPFLWTSDMSSYDSILNLPFNIPFYGSHVSLFTILMSVSMVLFTAANSQMTTVQGPMKTMQYIMPVMLLFFFNTYPSGLTYYYFISNIVSYGQIVLFRKFIDEDKIKTVMEENKKKNANKKKSKFQQRLEDAMKASQEAQKNSKKK